MIDPKKAAAIVAICCGAGLGVYKGLPYYEGEKTVAYPDASPHRIWTYCVGETRRPDGTPVQKGDTANREQCRDQLAKRVGGDFLPGVERCITRAMPIKVEVGFVDMAYNIGVPKFCKSSVARRWNAGDLKWACLDMRLYVKSGTVTLKGLVKRRGDTSDLCIEGIEEVAA